MTGLSGSVTDLTGLFGSVTVLFADVTVLSASLTVLNYGAGVSCAGGGSVRGGGAESHGCPLLRAPWGTDQTCSIATLRCRFFSKMTNLYREPSMSTYEKSANPPPYTSVSA